MAVGSNRYTIVLRTEFDTRNTGPTVSDTHAACPHRIPRTNELKQGGHSSPRRPREVDKEEKSVVEFRATQCLVYQLRARGTLIHPVTHTRTVDKCGDRTAGRRGLWKYPRKYPPFHPAPWLCSGRNKPQEWRLVATCMSRRAGPLPGLTHLEFLQVAKSTHTTVVSCHWRQSAKQKVLLRTDGENISL